MILVLFAFIRRYAVFIVCGIAALFGFVAISPRIFDGIEYRFGMVLPYEAVVRLTLLVVYAALLVGGLWWVILRGQRKHLMVWGVLALSFAAFAVVALGDQSHRLMEEFSWIRYTTGVFLVGAGGVGLIRFFASLRMTYGVRPQNDKKDGFQNDILMGLLGVAFLYAAADEMFEIHEKFGQWLGSVVALSPNATDYITIAYAVVGLVVVCVWILSARLRLASRMTEKNGRGSMMTLGQWVKESPFAMRVLFAGIATYALSTIFDTVDFWVLERLRALGAFWATHADSFVTDATYLFWAPRNFLNGLEELLEQIAAALFFAAMVSAVLERGSRAWMEQWLGVSKNIKLFLVSCTLFFVAVLTAMALVGGSPSVHLVPGDRATIIASVPQGLFHADDVVYHPKWGVVVANEGRGTIYQWKDGEWGQIPDPEHRIQNPDSIAVDDTHLYVADSAQGIIFVYRLDSIGAPRLQDGIKIDGLLHPETLVVVGDTLYVLDEGEKTIVKITQDGMAESWRPDHSKWIAPESIAYDEIRKKLYVSDDESGAVFSVDFEKRALREVATLPRPEDIMVLPDGSLLATDTRTGAIFRVYPEDGRVEKIVQFKRPYRDLQGIAFDGEWVYVISADGFGSSSFMPSFLWQLWITLA